MSPAWSKDPKNPTWCVRISGRPYDWCPVPDEDAAIRFGVGNTVSCRETMIGRGYLKPHGQLIVTMIGYIDPDGQKRNWRGPETMR